MRNSRLIGHLVRRRFQPLTARVRCQMAGQLRQCRRNREAALTIWAACGRRFGFRTEGDSGLALRANVQRIAAPRLSAG